MNPVSAVRLHGLWRWTGAPLAATGLLIWMWAMAIADPLGLLAAVVGGLLALTAYGANHDTAMALALQAREGGADVLRLPASVVLTLDSELARDPEGTRALRPAPIAALLLPVVAAGIQALGLWTMFGR